MMYRNSTRLLVAALVAGVAACADSTAPSRTLPDALLTRDAATDAADATSQDLSQMLGGELLAGLPMTTSGQSSPDRGGCTYSPSVGRFLCPAITNLDGLTVERSFAVYAGGVAQSSYSATATDSMNFQTSLTGTLSREGRMAWLNTARTMTVSGLAGAETQRSWSGVGTRFDSVHVTNDGVARRTRIRSIDRIASVVYALPRTENPFPKSGTITHDVAITSVRDDATGSSTRSVTRHVVVTFNGTQIATVLVGTTPCALDLVTRKLTCR